MSMRRWLVISLLFVTLLCPAQQRRALLVGVANYPEGSGWRKIHADNDVSLLESVLSNSFSVKSNKANKQRKLEENDFKFEIEIEDKFGKKYKYNDYNDAPEIIEEGLQGNKYIYDENGIKMIANYSLLLLIIPLILF